MGVRGTAGLLAEDTQFAGQGGRQPRDRPAKAGQGGSKSLSVIACLNQ